MRLDELALAGMPVAGSTISTTKSGNYPRTELQLDNNFWRVVGLYLAEGWAGGSQLRWSFHPHHEEHLVDEVVAYWLRQNVRANVRTAATAP